MPQIFGLINQNVGDVFFYKLKGMFVDFLKISAHYNIEIDTMFW